MAVAYVALSCVVGTVLIFLLYVMCGLKTTSLLTKGPSIVTEVALFQCFTGGIVSEPGKLSEFFKRHSVILDGFVYYIIHLMPSYISVYLQWNIMEFVFGKEAPIGAMISSHQVLSFVVFGIAAHMFEGGPFRSLKWVRASFAWTITCWIIFGIWGGSIAYFETKEQVMSFF